MAQLRLLPQNLINQIAAGEVVERPYSVVKELVENALDAGATAIQVVLRDGGKSYLAVIDNGCGMTVQELPLAIERHATSKLPNDNLFDIGTLGFRGEALPSIGSISRLTLTSCHQAADTGWTLSVQGGQKGDLKPSAHNQGTKIEVADLFYATPARLKFLKTATTETKYIVEMLNRLALAFPMVHFTLKSDDKMIFDHAVVGQQEADCLTSRLKAILGNDFIQNALPIDAEKDGVILTGYISMPTLNRSAATHQYFFVNGRTVKDKLFAGALRAAYQDFLARDRHPLVVLFLQVPPTDVDVNVHPAKVEVRFRDPQQVRTLIVGGLSHALRDMGCQTSTTCADDTLSKFQIQPGSIAPSVFQQSLQYTSQTPASSLRFSQPSRPFSKSVASFGSRPQEKLSLFQQPLMPAVRTTSSEVNESHHQEAQSFPLGAACAQLHQTYIVSQTEDGLVIVDQHAAHERLVYERMKKDFLENHVKSQSLLIPEVVELPQDDFLTIEPHLDDFKSFGLVIESFGECALLVREMPALLDQSNAQALVQAIVDALKEMDHKDTLKEHMQEVLASMSCHGSVRSGRPLNAQEMNDLLRQMEATPHTGQCNHGRPTYIKLALKDIEKLFGRR